MVCTHSAQHVGRIGALAVALGVGAALLTAPGTAWAEPADTADTADTETSAPAASPGTTANRTARTPRAARSTQIVAGDAPAASQPVATETTPSPRRSSRAGALSQPGSPLGAAAENSRSSVSVSTATAGPGSQRPDNDDPASTPAAPAVSAVPAAATSPRISVPAATAAPAAAVAALAVPSEPDSGSAAGSQLESAPVAVAAPVIAASAADTVSEAPTGVASRLLAAVGLSPLGAGGAPVAPVQTPALWALLAWTRREAARTMKVAPAQAVAPAATVAAAVTQPGSLPSNHVGWVTGQRNNGFPGFGWPQTNNTSWANVYGTDLGIMWLNGENDKVQLAFGDTFSGPNMSGDWRNNVLLLSEDTQLYDGLTLINTGPAFQFIPAARNAVFFIGSEVTNIPTAAVYANANNYVNYMSVKSWDSPGRWTTNYSAVSQYDPATDKWVLQRSTIRSAGWFRSSTSYRAGDQNFQQMAYVLQPESKVVDGEPRYIYAFGTPSGRQGSAFLSRVPEGAITDLGQYEYWDGERWVLDKPAVATRVIGDSDRSAGLFGFVRDIANDPNFFGGWFAGLTGAKTGGNVSEMSVQYNEYLDKYVVLYGNGLNNVILRTADTPEGPWSEPVTIATSITYPGLYAPFIHPLSGTGELTDANGDPDVSTLYWNMSLWGNYNVVLMETDLTPLQQSTLV